MDRFSGAGMFLLILNPKSFMGGWELAEQRGEDHSCPCRVLAKRLGPGAVAVGIAALTVEPDITPAGSFLAESAQVGPQLVVTNQAQPPVFEIAAQPESQFLFEWGGKVVRFDFPAEQAPGSFARSLPMGWRRCKRVGGSVQQGWGGDGRPSLKRAGYGDQYGSGPT